MSNTHTLALLRQVRWLFLIGASVLLAVLTGLYFWIGSKDYSAPDKSQLRLVQSFVMAVATNMVPVFLVFVGSYLLLRRIQQIQSEHDREALTLAIAEAVRADLSESIRASGVHDVFRRFYTDVLWGELFPGTTEFDLIVSYARTWKNTHREPLRKIATNRKATIRVVLANPDNNELMLELARRYELPVAEVTSCVRESLRDFAALLAGGSAECHIHVSNRASLYTYYRFDDVLVLSLFSNNNAKADRPGFLLNRDGTLTHFLKDEFDTYYQNSQPYNPTNAQ